MIISLDYDKTYTEEPKTWALCMGMLQAKGHCVIMVTARHESDPVELLPFFDVEVFYTGGRKKDSFMREVHGIAVDVWIDDRPHWIDTSDNWHYCEERNEWYQTGYDAPDEGTRHE